MATFKAVVFEHHKKADNTFNVKIRVNHKKGSVYLPTDIFVTAAQLNKKFEIKDRQIINRTNDIVKEYHELVVTIGNKIDEFSAKDLANFVQRKTSKDGKEPIDFIAFGRMHVERLKKNNQVPYARKIMSALNAMIDFFENEKIPITNLTVKSLQKFQEYLFSQRSFERVNQVNGINKYKRKGNSTSTVNIYFTYIRAVFNAAIDEFNDEDENEIRIKHYPFKKFKLPRPQAETVKRNLKPDIIRIIRDVVLKPTSRAELGRDIFMLSFYLVGINITDLFSADLYAKGRISYDRTKTSRRRLDNAFISIKVEPEAYLLFEKYKDPTGKRVFNFYQRYTSVDTFTSAANIGLSQISDKLKGEDRKITTYYARHSWATIARNICRISKDDVAMALNHTDPLHLVTDLYMEKDWIIIDEANRKVLDTIRIEIPKAIA
jgi:integrase